MSKNKYAFPFFALLLSIAFALAILKFSSGLSLIVTFLPAIPLAFLGLWLISYKKGWDKEGLLPIYLIAVGWQLLHFAEEYVTEFYIKFPQIVDGSDPYPIKTFVMFNMAAYFVFIMGGVLGILKGHRLAMLPVWFFVLYGVCGNLIAHIVFAYMNRGYFSGLYTALGYAIIAPILLKRLLSIPKSIQKAK